MATKDTFLSGLDIEKLLAQEAAGQDGPALLKGELQSLLDAIESEDKLRVRMLASYLVAPSPDHKSTISSKLLTSFNPEVATILEEKGLLDPSMLLKNISTQWQCLAWLLRNENSVSAAEECVGDRGTYYYEVPYRKSNLRTYLSRLTRHHPGTVISALLHSDLPSICKDKQNLICDWRTALEDRKNYYGSQDYIHHLGMDVVARTIGHPKKDQINYHKVALLVEKMISPQVMTAVYGPEGARQDMVCVQLEPLLFEALKTNSVANYGSGLSQLNQLATIFISSPKLSQAETKYWSFTNFDGRETGFRKGETNHRSSLNKDFVKDPRPQSFVSTLFRSGAPCVTDMLLSEGSDAEIMWSQLEKDTNLAGYISAASNSELKQILPVLISRLGYDWKDSSGNNMAHLIALFPYQPQRMLLNKLAKDAQGMDLFRQENELGYTPLSGMSLSQAWKKDRFFADVLERRIQEAQPKKRKQALDGMVKERVSAIAKVKPRPNM